MKSARYFKWMFPVCVLFLSFSCAGGHGGDDDDDGRADWGENIEGYYPVTAETTEDTCEPENIGFTEEWILTISQTSNYAYGWVSWVRAGDGSDPMGLFEGPVYGTTMILNATTEEPQGNAECVKIRTSSYSISVDTMTAALTGHTSEEVFFYGPECDSSTRSCRWSRDIGSAE